MLHTFTLVYLSVVSAFLHACSSNTRPVSALSFLLLKLTVVSSNAFHLFTCRVSTLWPACQLAFIFMWVYTQLCCLSFVMSKWQQWQLLMLLIGLAVFFKYTFNGTRVKRRKMPSVSPSARYTLSRNRSLLHLILAQCRWCWLFLTVDWQHVLATGRHTDV